jgi:hypothetical protein
MTDADVRKHVVQSVLFRRLDFTEGKGDIWDQNMYRLVGYSVSLSEFFFNYFLSIDNIIIIEWERDTTSTENLETAYTVVTS